MESSPASVITNCELSSKQLLHIQGYVRRRALRRSSLRTEFDERAFSYAGPAACMELTFYRHSVYSWDTDSAQILYFFAKLLKFCNTV